MEKKISLVSLLLVACITILCLLPFIAKAFHIDDPAYLWCAKQIYSNPLDFYGFTVNWYGYSQPMYMVNQNPPLVSYYISGVALFMGWSEVALHIAFLMPAACLSVGMYLLARFFCQHPSIAALIAVFSPAFLVSGTNVMADTLHMMFYVWSAVFWLRGMEKDDLRYFVGAGIFISLAALTKYFGLTMIPLLVVYSLISRRKFGSWIFFLMIPVLVILGYQVVTFLLYDNFLVFNAMNYAMDVGGGVSNIAIFMRKTLTGLSFVGGCLIGTLFFTHLLWSKKGLAIWAICLSLFFGVLLGEDSVRMMLIPKISTMQYGIVFQYALFVFAGIQVLLLAGIDVYKHRTPKALLLFLWVFGTFLFSSHVNWTTNARTILPMIPAVGIIMVRRINENYDLIDPTKTFRYTWPLIPALIISLSITWGDMALANSQRTMAYKIHEKFAGYPHTVWFQGHWGFQYYMEAYGAKAVDYDSPVQAGDIVVVPRNNTNLVWLGGDRYRDRFHLVTSTQVVTNRWIRTISLKNSAGFYSSLFGSLPFTIGIMEPEEYFIFLAGKFDNPEEETNYFASKVKDGNFEIP